MITVTEIKKKAERIYPEVLQSSLTEKKYFPKLIRADKSLSKDFVKMSQEIAHVMADSKDRKGFGYTVQSESVKTKLHGIQDIPNAIVFETLTDYLKFIGKKNEYELFMENCKIIKNQLPQINDWLILNPESVISNFGKWDELLKVCNWFLNSFEAHKYYIRELPINVHTKFIEGNIGILKNLLDFLIPDKLNSDKTDFEKRFNLKYAEPLIRMRFIDESITIIENVTDLSFTLDEFEKIKINCNKVFITENLMNFLTFPFVPKSIAIWGGGFRVENLKSIKWLKNKIIYYWGDLDSHGMQILSQLRLYYPHTCALMMDKDTLLKFQSDWRIGKMTNVAILNGLSHEEQEFFSFLKEQNIRLEQEKIPQSFVIEMTRDL